MTAEPLDTLPPDGAAPLLAAPLLAKAAFEAGMAERRQGSREAALAWLQRALTLDPAHRPARMERATLWRELGKLDEAEADYRWLLHEQPGGVFPLSGLGLCARLRRDLPMALQYLSVAAPLDRGARHEYATTLREMGQIEAAEAEYRLSLDAHPGWFPALIGLGLCARMRRDLPAALAHFTAALQAVPGDRGARHELATTLREMGQIEAAEAEYRTQLAAHPGWFPALLGLGLCARQRRDLPVAAEIFAGATAAAPNDRGARHEYATTLRELGRAEAAEAEYRTLLQAHPGWLPALVGLGLCARLRHDLPSAAEWLAKAVAAAPADRGARHELATVLREQGRAVEAEAEYQANLAAHPGWFPALLGLGLCARLRGDRAAALAHLQAAAAAQPDDPGVWLEVLSEYLDAGRLADAHAVAERLIAEHPAMQQGWLGLGRAERQAGQRAAALEAFRKGFEHCPAYPHFLIEMAVEAQALGRFAEAEAWLQQAGGHGRLAAHALTLQGEQARMAQRFEDAEALFRRAIAHGDAPVGAHGSLAQTLADLGRLPEALGVLEAAERHLGPRPDLAIRHVHLLRRAGLRDEALALARAACAAAPAHFGLWYERFENERFAPGGAGGTRDDLEALLAAAPAASVRDRALLHHARGVLAEQRWQLNEAAAEFRQGIALDDALGALHEALARMSLLLCDPDTVRQHLRASMRLSAPSRQLQGLSLHLMHTHLGQILDEFIMDAPMLQAVAGTLKLPPDQRAAALVPLARRAPDHTLAAIALLIALRQSGRFDLPAAAAAAGRRPAPIPASIAQFWDDATPPDDILRLMQSWTERNPGHRHTRFDKASAGAYLMARYTPDVVLAYRRAREPAMKADLFRLAWLFCEGGVYADADDRCLRPLADFVPPYADFVVYQEEYGTLGNNFMVAAPLHPVIGLALQSAVEAINRGDEDLLWLATGPGLITRSFVQTVFTSPLALPGWLERSAILHRHDLARGVAVHCLAGYKNTKRYWARAVFGAGPAAKVEAGNVVSFKPAR